MNTSTPVNIAAPQFIVVPQSGMQCPPLLLRRLGKQDLDTVWKSVQHHRLQGRQYGPQHALAAPGLRPHRL